MLSPVDSEEKTIDNNKLYDVQTLKDTPSETYAEKKSLKDNIKKSDFSVGSESDILKKIERVRQQLNSMVSHYDGSGFDQRIVELSQDLDILLVEHARQKERKKVEHNEHKYDLQFDEIIKIIPCALYVIKDSIIIKCNKLALDMFGYNTMEKVIGLKPYELSPEYQPDGNLSIINGQKNIERALNSKESVSFQWVHKRKNGEKFLGDIKIFNIDNILYAFVTDISEIGKLRARLTEKDKFYSKLLQSQNRAMMLIDPITGNIVDANKAAVKYYGYKKDILLNLRIQNINTLSENEIEEEMILAKDEKRDYFQFIHKLANNEKRQVEVHSFPIEVGKRKLLFSIIHDISDKLKQKLKHDTLFFDSPFGVAILDKEQKIVNINKNFTELFQYTFQEVKGKAINNLVSPLENKTQIDNNIELIYNGGIVKQEGIRKRRDGSLIEVEVIGYPVINHQEIIGVYIIYHDISFKKSYERELILFKKILENISEGVVITDANGNIEWINNAFNEITGYSKKEAVGRKINFLKSGIHEKSFYTVMWNELSTEGRWCGEIWNKNKAGDIYSEWLTINCIKDDSNEISHYVGIFKDLTERKIIDSKINDLRQKDSLTGLYNRGYFLEQVDLYIRGCVKKDEKCSIIFVDLKSFKEVNNSLGHIFADKLLIEISNRLVNLMKENYIISRFSNDEFVIFCKSISSEEYIINFSKVLLSNIYMPFTVENTIIRLNANIGISIFPQDGLDAETLTRRAEIAMHKAKESALYEPYAYKTEMSEEFNEKFILANQLMEAVPNNELYIVYQPIFDIKQPGLIVAAEALLRWNNSILGMVSPDKFIQIAEKTGQIISIGEWVLEQVCKQISIWQSECFHVVPIAVNVSVKQLEQIEFAQNFIEIIKKHNVKYSYIELEITESVSSGDTFTIVKNIKELKKYGIRISMDDFGTGFSSLGNLDLFELDKLKIDKIFINGMVNVSKKQKIVKSIIAMAKSLGLIVVAEGVETEEQRVYLEELGCLLGQGYLVSCPLSAKEMESFLSSNY
jgi:diguanylate cyclase (GGDEF)-like protein/PAS domain S-box-containing protein